MYVNMLKPYIQRKILTTKNVLVPVKLGSDAAYNFTTQAEPSPKFQFGSLSEEKTY